VLKMVAYSNKLRHTWTKLSRNYNRNSYVFLKGAPSPSPGLALLFAKVPPPRKSEIAMSPLRRHGGGRPRSADSILDVAERWGISQKAARRLAALKLGDDEMAVLVCDSKRMAAAQRREITAQGRYTGGMKALGMRSRIPAGRA
jgi:hypothetical protein